MENSSKDIAIRYTDETYASKDEVRKSLNTSLVDPFWDVILSYRSQFNKPIGLSNIAQLNYHICLTPEITAKCSNISLEFNKCLSNYLSLDDTGKQNIKYSSRINSLLSIGEYYGETISKEFAYSVIQKKANNFQGLSLAKKKVINYYDALILLEDKKVNIDADYLIKLYLALSKKENIVNLYRTFDFVSNDANVINREYNGAPFQRIEQMMNQFFDFLASNNISEFIKASGAIYFLNYVKPFDDYNFELSLLIAKTIISNEDKELIGYLLPLELIAKRKSTLDNDFKEVDRNNDLTYALTRLAVYMQTVTETFLDTSVNLKIDDLRVEHAPKAEDIDLNDKSVSNDLKSTENETVPIEDKVGTVAVHSIESGLEEKDAHKFEKYLLEKNPRLKPTQAHFYARHCTIGSYYTIQMYKKAERVVYETARTSMDALANFGYYKKEQIKNKFVYTPIKQEEKL